MQCCVVCSTVLGNVSTTSALLSTLRGAGGAHGGAGMFSMFCDVTPCCVLLGRVATEFTLRVGRAWGYWVAESEFCREAGKG